MLKIWSVLQSLPLNQFSKNNASFAARAQKRQVISRRYRLMANPEKCRRQPKPLSKELKLLPQEEEGHNSHALCLASPRGCGEKGISLLIQTVEIDFSLLAFAIVDLMNEVLASV
jgi:hypothetical protein